MKTESKETKVKMVRLSGDALPLVEVEFQLESGNKKGLMVLDSGCVHSIVFSDVTKDMPSEYMREDISINVTGVGDSSKIRNGVEVGFSLGGKVFREVMIAESQDFLGIVDDMPILGILGNVFLMKHGLAIDFTDYTLHTSEVDHSNFCVADSSFFFSMETIQHYGVPVIAIVNSNNKECVTLIDTGATVNAVITRGAMERLGMNYEMTDKEIELDNLGNTEKVPLALCEFDIANWRGDNNIEHVKYKAECAISSRKYLLSNNVWSNDEGSDFSNIEALIGCPTLSKFGWVLDFGAMIIYKRK